jgi:auxin influx carrier (AUX1 LAX family)
MENGSIGMRSRYIVLMFFFGGVLMRETCSNIFLLNDHLDKREWTYIFGACCMVTVLVPSFHNYRLWSFFGLIMISYTAWYMTIAALAHGQVATTFYLPTYLSKNKNLI